MTTPLDTFRNPPGADTLASVNPLLITGAPSFYGQTDVEGNIAYFNNLDANIIKPEQGLIVPFGNQQVTGNPTIATDGAFHYVAGVTATGISTMPTNANGDLLVPIPGAYMYDVSIRITVTSPSTNWIVTIGTDINGQVLNPSDFVFPASMLTANMNFTVNLTTFFPSDFVAAGNTAAVGFQVKITGAATATVSFLDGQLDYLGTFSGNAKVRPSMFNSEPDIIRGVDTPLWTP